MKCERCIYCIASDNNSYMIDCEIFGEDTHEKYFCRYYLTKKEKAKYDKLKAKVEIDEER